MKSLWSLRDLGRAYAAISTDARAPVEAEAAIAGAARVEVEALSSRELRSLAEIQARFASRSAANAMLLPPIAVVTDAEISSAIERIAGVPVLSVERTDAAAIRERRMRAVLAELAEMMHAVHTKPNRVV